MYLDGMNILPNHLFDSPSLSSSLSTMSRFFRQAGDSDSSDSESEDELMSSGDEATAPKAAAPKTGGSRFLRTASDSSSSSSSESDESDSDDDRPKTEVKKGKFLTSGGGSDSSDESDEEGPKVKIKSATEKRLDEMEATGKTIDNALKINDWVAISNGMLRMISVSARSHAPHCLEFDKLARMIQRQQNISESISPFYIRTLVSLESSSNSTIAKEKKADKKMNATNAKALTAMKQKIKKASKEHETQIKKFQEVCIYRCKAAFPLSFQP